MKLLLIGDVHLRASRPSMRKDDFIETQMNKMKEIASLFIEHNCTAALCTGDLFDRHDPPISLLNRYMDVFDKFEGEFYCPPGNHDLYGASVGQLENSALYNLVKAGKVKLLGGTPTFIGRDFGMWGSAYFTDDLLVNVENSSDFKVLVAHNMILEDKLWAEQPEDFFEYPTDFVAKHPHFDLILCGHYHYKVHAKVGKTEVINPGAVVRVKASKGDMALKPAVVVYDTETKKDEWVFLKAAKPVEEVFFPKEEKVDMEDPKLEAFVNSVMQGHVADTGLDSIVEMVLKESSCSDGVRSVVLSAIAEAREGEND